MTTPTKHTRRRRPNQRDEELLLQIAILLESGRAPSREAAMKTLGIDHPSNLRRLHAKFAKREVELRAQARRQLAPPPPVLPSNASQPMEIPTFDPGHFLRLLKAYENSPFMKTLQRDSHYLTKWQQVFEQTQPHYGIAAKMADLINPRYLRTFEEIQKQNSHLLRMLGVRPPNHD